MKAFIFAVLAAVASASLTVSAQAQIFVGPEGTIYSRNADAGITVASNGTIYTESGGNYIGSDGSMFSRVGNVVVDREGNVYNDDPPGSLFWQVPERTEPTRPASVNSVQDQWWFDDTGGQVSPTPAPRPAPRPCRPWSYEEFDPIVPLYLLNEIPCAKVEVSTVVRPEGISERPGACTCAKGAGTCVLFRQGEQRALFSVTSRTCSREICETAFAEIVAAQCDAWYYWP